eukprot:scaffold8637_cov130-Skeletonema_marinoi.AAC.2
MLCFESCPGGLLRQTSLIAVVLNFANLLGLCYAKVIPWKGMTEMGISVKETGSRVRGGFASKILRIPTFVSLVHHEIDKLLTGVKISWADLFPKLINNTFPHKMIGGALCSLDTNNHPLNAKHSYCPNIPKYSN